MITVKIRDYETAESTLFGEVPFDQVDDVVNRLKADGVERVGIDRVHEIQTQWVLDDGAKEFYLEVILGEEDE